MARGHRNIAICTYRVKCGEEKQFGDLLREHWKVLRTFGLVSDRDPQVFLGIDEAQATVIVEIFEWLDDGASARAELLPQVLAIWDPMTACCEERLGHPAMEFPHYEQVDLGGKKNAKPAKKAAKKAPVKKKPAAKKVPAKKTAKRR